MDFFGEYMSVLFLSSENFISEQDMLLLLSFAKTSEPFVYVCPEGSWIASIAQHNSIATLELPQFFWKQFFTLRLYLRRIQKNEKVIIHVFDAKALKLAKWLCRSMRSSITLVASFHEPLRLSKAQPFSIPKDDVQNHDESFQKKHVFSPLRAKNIDNTLIIREYLAKKIKCLYVSSPELHRVLETHNMPYNSLALLPYAYHTEEQDFMCQGFENFNALDESSKSISSLSMTLENYDIKNRFIFLIDTDMEEESGLQVLLQALVIIKEKIVQAQSDKEASTDSHEVSLLPKHVQVHICGTGAKFDEFVQEAIDLQIEDMLAFFGDFDASLLYKKAHALICPATSGEGNFRCIIKAFIESLPVVSSDISPHTKIVLTGKTQRCALIFPRDNAQTLANCMLHVMTDMPLRQELIQEGHEVLSKIDYLNLVDIYQTKLKKI